MIVLEVVTRAYRRPQMLADNVASVQALGEGVLHTILHDEVGIGVAAANARLAEVAPVGEYVWVLDDDDLCIHAGLADDIHYLAWLHDAPPAFVVRMDHGVPLGVLPSMDDWGRLPRESGIGASAIITRRDVWMAHRQRWATGRYAADYDFIAGVWAEWGPEIVWHDVIASRCQRISRGAPE